MIHDSLCPCKPCGKPHSLDIFSDSSPLACNDCQGMGECQCDLIAKVRGDCLEKIRGAFIVGTDSKVLTPSHPEYSHDGTEIWNSAINTAIAYMTGAID